MQSKKVCPISQLSSKQSKPRLWARFSIGNESRPFSSFSSFLRCRRKVPIWCLLPSRFRLSLVHGKLHQPTMARLTLAWRPGQCPTWRTSRKSSTPVHWWKRLNAEVHEEIIRWALSSSKTYMHSNETGNLSLFHLLSLCTKPLCDKSMQFNLKLIWSTLPLHIFVTVSNVLLCKLKLFRSNAPTPRGGGYSLIGA